MHIIIFSGSHDLNVLGATKTMDINLVKFIAANDYDVTWVGRGRITNPPCRYIDIGDGKIIDFKNRVFNKISRTIFKKDIQDILYKDYLKFDIRMAKLIKNGNIIVDSDTLLIGRNVMSLKTFTEVKKKGGKTILQSQWMHPLTHNQLLKKEFKKIGIVKEPIKSKRIDRQLSEINDVDFIWCISNLVKNSYLSNKVSERKLIDLSLGVDFEKYNASHIEKSHKRNEFVILFVGNVNAEKGAHILLEAVNKSGLQNIKIIFNGRIPEYFESVFNEQANKLISKNISIKVMPGDPLKNYRLASIFVLPSVHESFGLVVLEAMSAGLPVIVSDMVGAKDCVEENSNGYIFKSGDINQLSFYIKKLYKDKKLAKIMSKNSIKIAKGYDWKFIVNNLIKFINKISQLGIK